MDERGPQASATTTTPRPHPRAAHPRAARTQPAQDTSATRPAERIGRRIATGTLAAGGGLARMLAWLGSRVAAVLVRLAHQLRPAWLQLPAWIPTARSGRRGLALTTVLAAALAVLAARLVQVQVMDAPELRAQSLEQAERIVTLHPDRGRILDRSGALLAASEQSPTLMVDPAVYTEFHADGSIDPDEGEVRRADVVAALASRLEDVTPGQVRSALLDDPDSRFAVITQDVGQDVADEVLALGLPGVHTFDEPVRRYPLGAVTAPLLGFTNGDGEGAAGLESQFDDLLTGQPGSMYFEVDARRVLDIATFRRNVTPSIPGQDLVLTIDRELQGIATHVANETMAAHDAKAVSIVVLDARTAEVLAAVSTPGFDPEKLERDQYWGARPFTDAVEPGSVQKIVTVAAALEDGVIDRTTVIDVPATWTVGGKTWYEDHSGPMTPARIIESSSNVGSMKIGELVGAERLHDWLLTFGYGQPTGVAFPGETPGSVPAVENWSATSLPTISIGHGLSMSTLQLASAYQTIANDGERVQPTLVRGSLDEDGELVPSEPSPSSDVLSAATASQLRRMLRRVVEGENGTGSRAAVEGYGVGGKTGTADKPRDGGYSEETTAVFAGMAPIDDPELVIAVMVDEPVTRFGSLSAAPAFAQVMTHALAVRDVVPDTSLPPIEEALAAARAEAADHEAAEAAAQARAERQQRRAIRQAVRQAATVVAGTEQPRQAGARRGADSDNERDGAPRGAGQRAGQG